MIYIIHTGYFLMEDLQKNVDRRDVEFIEVKLKKVNLFEKIIRKVQSNKFERWLHLDELNNKIIKKDDIIIFFDCFTGPYLSLIKKYQKNRKIVWIWNKIRKSEFLYLVNLKKEIKEIWTFDFEDSLRYNLKFSPQFYWRQLQNKFLKKEGLFFIGLNKGRAKKLDKLSSVYDGLKEFNVVNRTIYEKIIFKKFNLNKFLNYEETIKKIKKCECLVEINLKNQSGITLRTLEALFFKKKLITDNKNIKKYDFFNSNNILIFDENITEELIVEFLNKKYLEIDRKILKKYTFEKWLDRLLIKE